MIETEVCIILNRIEDLKDIETILKGLKIQSPVFIVDLIDSFYITFTSDYEFYELNTQILNHYKDYELTTDLGNGRKEIRIEIKRSQSPFSTDGWGRQIETPLNETLYLIKKSKTKQKEFSPKVKVLFEDIEQDYFINIVKGKNTNTNEKGYLIIDSYENLYGIKSDGKPIIQNLHKKLVDAFWSGFRSLNNFVNLEFEEYLKLKKKLNRKRKKN